MTDDQPLLVAEGLGKLYGGRVGCLDVSFALWPGEVLAIVGESGSGKSTLLKCLSMQLEPSSGRFRPVPPLQRKGRLLDSLKRDAARSFPPPSTTLDNISPFDRTT